MVDAASWFATCPKGLEGLLRDELATLGAAAVKETVAGVSFDGPLSLGYRACLWSRFATQILLPLARYPCESVDQLYEGALAIAWADHLTPRETISVRFSGRLTGINNTQFGAQRVKDAVADAARAHFGARPSVSRRDPDLRIAARVHRGHASIFLNLSGESLHRRGYRQVGGAAPLKENLAAALIARSRWLASDDEWLVDPLCGSGTLLIEALEMRLGRPASHRRMQWGFERWGGHESAVWAEVVAEGAERVRESASVEVPSVRGWDADGRMVDAARRNIQGAGLAASVRIEQGALDAVELDDGPGLLIANPPYGERLGDAASLLPLYESLGGLLDRGRECRGAVFTTNPDLGRAIGRAPDRTYRLANGAMPARLLLFAPGGTRAATPRLSESAQMFANRLAKKARALVPWAKRRGIDCYRIYDADLPEYALAVDRYADWVHVSEYRAPASIDASVAARRLTEAVMSIPGVLGVPSHRIVVKQRSRQRGSAQYDRRGSTQHAMEVREGPARLTVNLVDYLDTGLFLDHRPLRLRLPELTRGRKFLNLFCYTAAATVQAALGGAEESVSVDLSRTYLTWAEENFQRNGIDSARHRLVRADCATWLARGSARFDVILLDPPTFSNSRRTELTLDVQRDHVSLIDAAARRLARDGLLIFSTNRRRFALDPALADAWQIEDVTRWSRDRDFARARQPHHCWFLTRP